MTYRAGEWVVVKSHTEILATLDASGEIGAMPFMPEMLQYCGGRFQVVAVAHKTCDTIHKTGGRRVPNAVHLSGLRCEGSGHGGCQAACLLFWRTEWLRPAPRDATAPRVEKPQEPAAVPSPGEELLHAAAIRVEAGENRYSCQATRLFDFTTRLPWWDLRQYARDLWSGNVRPGRFLRVSLMRLLFHLRKMGFGFRITVALYDRVHRVLMRRPSPYRVGIIPHGQPTPTGTLDLAVGEWVEVKSHEQVRATLTENNVNRGMRFDPEMTPFCGGRYQVAARVERLIDERTGRMIPMRSPCIVLRGVVCQSEYSDGRIFCPRAIPPYFREIWLNRVAADPGQQSQRARLGATGGVAGATPSQPV